MSDVRTALRLRELGRADPGATSQGTCRFEPMTERGRIGDTRILDLLRRVGAAHRLIRCERLVRAWMTDAWCLGGSR